MIIFIMPKEGKQPMKDLACVGKLETQIKKQTNSVCLKKQKKERKKY